MYLLNFQKMRLVHTWLLRIQKLFCGNSSTCLNLFNSFECAPHYCRCVTFSLVCNSLGASQRPFKPFFIYYDLKGHNVVEFWIDIWCVELHHLFNQFTCEDQVMNSYLWCVHRKLFLFSTHAPPLRCVIQFRALRAETRVLRDPALLSSPRLFLQHNP